MELNTCGECGVPEYITSEHLWTDGGHIVQARDRRHILTFIESDNLDTLFHGIEDILGQSIERLVLATRRRAGRAYMDRVIPEQVKQAFRKGELELGPLIEAFFSIGHVLGYGRFELSDYRYRWDEGDYISLRVERPYSVYFGFCDPVAAFEALTGDELGFTYSEVSEGTYEVKAFRSSHPEEFKGRLMMKLYEQDRGDVEPERCPACGGPRALSSYEWDIDKGIITNRYSGRRMAFFAPTVLDAVFQELEKELGESIPEVVIEAQRRFAKTGAYAIEDFCSEGSLREQLALRGLGNLKEMRLEREGLSMTLENAVMGLLVVGLAQGIFEISFGVESDVEWGLSEEGELGVKVEEAGGSQAAHNPSPLW